MRYLEYLKKMLDRTAIDTVIIGDGVYCLRSFRSRPISDGDGKYSLKFGKTKEQAVICLGKNFREQTKFNDFTFSTMFLEDNDLRKRASFPETLDLRDSHVLTNKNECCRIITTDSKKMLFDEYLELYYNKLPEIVSKMENAVLRIITGDGKMRLLASKEIVWAEPTKNDSHLIEFSVVTEDGCIDVKCDDYGRVDVSYKNRTILGLEPLSWVYRIKKVLDSWWEGVFGPPHYETPELEDCKNTPESQKFCWDWDIGTKNTHLFLPNPPQNSTFIT